MFVQRDENVKPGSRARQNPFAMCPPAPRSTAVALLALASIALGACGDSSTNPESSTVPGGADPSRWR